MTYELMVEDTFSAAHQLRDYEGQCENLHGHTFRVQVFVKGDDVGKTGMVLDFKKFKNELRSVLEEFDHTNLNAIPLFAEQNPTAENLSREIYNKLRVLNPSQVVVWESDSAYASYEE